jgi:hypothetical protein
VRTKLVKASEGTTRRFRDARVRAVEGGLPRFSSSLRRFVKRKALGHGRPMAAARSQEEAVDRMLRSNSGSVGSNPREVWEPDLISSIDRLEQ